MIFSRRTLIFSTVSAALAQDRKPDLSGHWEMDFEQSELGNKMRKGGYRETLIIDHREPNIRIDYSLHFNNSSDRVIYELVSDGRISLTRTPVGEDISRTIWEGSKLVTTGRIDGNPEDYKWVRYLSRSGSVLYVEYGFSPTPKKLVFRKKPA